jgi:hypothetical protein
MFNLLKRSFLLSSILFCIWGIITPVIADKDTEYYTIHIYVDTGSSMVRAIRATGSDVLDRSTKEIPTLINKLLNGKYIGSLPLKKNYRIFVTPFCSINGAIKYDTNIEKRFSYLVGEATKPDFSKLKDFYQIAPFSCDKETYCSQLLTDKAWPQENPQTIFIILSNSQKQLKVDLDIRKTLEQNNSAIISCKLPRMGAYEGDSLRDEITKRMEYVFKEAVAKIKPLKRRFEISSITSPTGNNIHSSNPEKKISILVKNKSGYDIINTRVKIECQGADITPQSIDIAKISKDQVKRVVSLFKFSNFSERKKIILVCSVPGIKEKKIQSAKRSESFNYIIDTPDVSMNWILPDEIYLNLQHDIDFSNPIIKVPLLNVQEKGKGDATLEATQIQDQGNIIAPLTISRKRKTSTGNIIKLSDTGKYSLNIKLSGSPSDWVDKTAKIKLTLKTSEKIDIEKVKEIKFIGYTQQIIKFNSTKLKVGKDGIGNLPIILTQSADYGLRFPCKIKIVPSTFLKSPADGIVNLIPEQALQVLKFDVDKLSKLEKLTIKLCPIAKEVTKFEGFKQAQKTTQISLPLDYNNFSSKFKLTVKGSKGSGSYKANTVIQLKAIPPSKNKVFKKWTGDVKYLDRLASSPSNAIKMPMRDVKLIATYKIKATPPPPPIEVTADFSCKQKKEEIIAGTPIKFKNKSINANNFEWNFENKKTSIKENPTHIFREPGFYKIQLIAYAEDGSKDTKTLKIEVLEPPNSMTGLFIILLIVGGIVFIVYKLITRKPPLFVTFYRNGKEIGNEKVTSHISFEKLGSPKKIILYNVWDKDDKRVKIEFLSDTDEIFRSELSGDIVLRAEKRTPSNGVGKYTIIGTNDYFIVTESEDI